MKVKLNIIKAFTQDISQGNPAGIVLEADNLTEQDMINITAQSKFSECAFVQTSSQADFKIRFFTAQQEVDLCAHATIACFSVLAQQEKNSPKLFTQETRIGVLPVYCYPDGFVQMEQTQGKFIPFPHDKNKIATLLNICSSAINGPLHIVSTGSPKLIIPIISLDALFSIKPDSEGIKEYCKLSGARGFYPFTQQTIEDGSDFHARQFNPLAGIYEDPVTGVAAGALGIYSKHITKFQKNTFIVEQGLLLKKFGKIVVNLTDKVLVGGYAVKVGEKEFFI